MMVLIIVMLMMSKVPQPQSSELVALQLSEVSTNVHVWPVVGVEAKPTSTPENSALGPWYTAPW